MIGVGVVAWVTGAAAARSVVLWLDPSFAHYFWTTLLVVGRDLGGVAVNEGSGLRKPVAPASPPRH